MNEINTSPLTAAHWGVYRAEVVEGKLKGLHPFDLDPDPSAIGNGYLDVLDDGLRIRSPMVRKSWLENGPGSAADRRGADPFVAIDWHEAEDLVASELHRVSAEFGNRSIYGGSYGWSGAGRFHHAQSQLHRFLNCNGGYTRSVNSYSLAAGEVILSHILGESGRFIHNPPSWRSVAHNTQLLVAFGGLPLRNSQISAGGTGRHRARQALEEARNNGAQLVNISPDCSDIARSLDAQWLPARPGSDVALMLGLAYELILNDWHDAEFLSRYTTGFARFARYLSGAQDGIAKSARWAAGVTGLSDYQIVDLARRMAHSRTMISVSWSLTRQEHGEQPFWMATTLAAMLGQIGLPGGGVAFGYCAANSMGSERRPVRFEALPQLDNPIDEYIPVARISDMLLNPGAAYEFNGETRTFPDIQLIYWAGGNPFHHHQDLTRLCEAWAKPQTIIVNDWCWNALAKRADIILPCTNQLERDDLMLTPRDPFIVAMDAVVAPPGEARDDYDIFRGISRRLGTEERFSEGRTSQDWLRWLYEQSRVQARETGVDLPDYSDFRRNGWHEIEAHGNHPDAFEAFRDDPLTSPLKTPSGRIEITSETVETTNALPHPHPAWYPPEEWLGRDDRPFPFHLISSQPAEKLHSQLDHGSESRRRKRKGRSPLHINPEDARRLSIGDGDTVRVHNARGACLATATLDPGLMPGVLKISTGAWFDAAAQADGTLLCRHGNPNTLTCDRGTSPLAQGPTAQSCLVAVEPYDDNEPILAFEPPGIEQPDHRDLKG